MKKNDSKRLVDYRERILGTTRLKDMAILMRRYLDDRMHPKNLVFKPLSRDAINYIEKIVDAEEHHTQIRESPEDAAAINELIDRGILVWE